MSIPGNVQLNHPRLAALGKVSLVVYDFDRDNVRVVIESRSEDLNVRLVDVTGIAHESHVKSMENDSTAFLFPIKDSALAKGRLEIMWGYRTVEVPFELENIEITKPAD